MSTSYLPSLRPDARAQSPPPRSLVTPAVLERLLYWGLLAAGMLWLTGMAINSAGSPYEDEIAHYLLNRSAWQQPDLILDRWARSLYTLLYMVPSLFGLLGARLGSVALAGLIVHLTARIAARLGLRHLWLVPLLLCFQPWFGAIFHATITQVPFTLCLTLGLYFWLEDRWELASVAFSLMPLLRDESLVLLGLWGLILLARRRWRAAILCAVPILLYNIIYLLTFQVPLDQTPLGYYFSPYQDNLYFEYGTKPLSFYPIQALVGVGPLIMGLAIVGLRPFLALGRRALPLGRRALPLAFFAIYFGLHMGISAFGLYHSGNFWPFVGPTAPGFALLAALGTDWLIFGVLPGSLARIGARLPRDVARWLPVAAATVLAVGVVFGALGQPPAPLSPLESAVEDAAAWVQAEGIPPEDVIAPHFYYAYFTGTPWIPADFWQAGSTADQALPGTVLLWEAQYASNLGIAQEALDAPGSGWQAIQRFGGGRLIVYQRVAEG